MICFIKALVCVLLVCALAIPASAQPLTLPLTGGRIRPVESQTLFHTLFSDFYSEDDDTTYVQTGDIPAMWLRDSSAQTLPYVRFAPAFPILAVRFAGVVERNARNIESDPYANAFRADYTVWERKWEVGSLAWPVILAWSYWQQTHLRLIFTPALHGALRKVVDTYRCEQLHAQCSRYNFTGVNQNRAYQRNTGMIWGAFRPSDDAVTYPFNIPQQAIAAVALQDVAHLALDGYGDRNLANEAQSMATQVALGVMKYGRVYNSAYGGWVYVYETDGLGHDLYLDDANIPNLTALPYIGWCSPNDSAYLNTRAYTLSTRNPYYFRGVYGEGLGSPHTPPGFVWPLGIIARALTATSASETAESITTLAQTDSKDGLIHESFWPDGYWLFTRAYFGWANALYAELLFRSLAGFPATPFPASGRPVLFEERLGVTPVLTTPLVQLKDTAILYRALADLLERANGHTIIPGIEQLIQSTASTGGPTFHEVHDSHQ
ncbi:MAG TPA: glycoside hydrolase family 125 protein [Candidatus Baltobacteraceae bacterium]|nr:glycoside hydrolase family 125 protein [Candidatus Baltobacteraceae bacterium]